MDNTGRTANSAARFLRFARIAGLPSGSSSRAILYCSGSGLQLDLLLFPGKVESGWV